MYVIMSSGISLDCIIGISDSSSGDPLSWDRVHHEQCSNIQYQTLFLWGDKKMIVSLPLICRLSTGDVETVNGNGSAKEALQGHLSLDMQV